jgi:hypothetical protein
LQVGQEEEVIMANATKFNGQYEVLNPWAEADSVPLRGISPRLAELNGKTIGLFVANAKIASRPIITVVEQKLREKLPSLKFKWFLHNYKFDVSETEDRESFEAWAKEIDGAVAAVGD